jgi:hypothetical protein
MQPPPVRTALGMEHRRAHPYKSSMPQLNRTVITILAALAASVAAAGCAATQVPETPIERAQRIEPMLNAAGFRVLPADTPERRSQLASMTPLQIRFTPHEGRMQYWFADPYYCNCLYIGNDKAYDAFAKELEQIQIANQQEMAAQMNEDAAAEQENMTFMAWPADEIFY